MKQTILLLLMLCFINSVKAQTMNTKWVLPKSSSPAKATFYRALGIVNKEIVFAYAKQQKDNMETVFQKKLYQDKFSLEFYNAISLKKGKVYTMDMAIKKKKSVDTDLVGIYLFTNRIAVFYQETEKKHDSRKLLMDFIDPATGEWMDEEKVIFEETINKIVITGSSFFLYEIPSDKSVVVFTIHKKKEKNPKATITHFDTNGEIVHQLDEVEFLSYNPSSKYVFPIYEVKHIDIHDNKLYLQTLIKNMRNNYNQHENHLSEFNLDSKEINYYTLSTEKRMSGNFVAKFDTKNHLLHFASLYSDKTSSKINGLSLFTLNTQNSTTINNQFSPFSSEQCSFMSPKKDKKDETKDYVEEIYVRDIILKENGGFIFLLEYLLEYGISTKVGAAGSTQVTNNGVREYKDIYLLNLDAKGEIEKIQKIARLNEVWQHSFKLLHASTGFILGAISDKSFTTFKENNKLAFVFFDLAGNTSIKRDEFGVSKQPVIESKRKDEPKLSPTMVVYNLESGQFEKRVNLNKQSWKNFFNNPEHIWNFEQGHLILNVDTDYQLIGRMNLAF